MYLEKIFTDCHYTVLCRSGSDRHNQTPELWSANSSMWSDIQTFDVRKEPESTFEYSMFLNVPTGFNQRALLTVWMNNQCLLSANACDQLGIFGGFSNHRVLSRCLLQPGSSLSPPPPPSSTLGGCFFSAGRR